MKPASELAREAITPQLVPGEQLRSVAAFQTASAFGWGPIGILLGGTPIARQKAYWVGITDQRAIVVPRNLAWLMAQAGTLDPTKGAISIPLNDVVCTVIPGQQVCLTVPGVPKPQTLTLVYLHGPGWGDGMRGYMDDFLAALKQPPSAEEQLAQSHLTQDEHVLGFYKTTHDAWSRGLLSNLTGTTRQQEASALELGDFIKKYPPEEGSALRVFFEQFQPREGEFLVTRADLGLPKKRPWFLLTNLRLIQWDGRDDTFREIILAEVQSYQTNKTPEGATLMFKLRSGEELVFERVPMMPTAKVLMELAQGQTGTPVGAPAA
jgi:hypothetical protein